MRVCDLRGLLQLLLLCAGWLVWLLHDQNVCLSLAFHLGRLSANMGQFASTAVNVLMCRPPISLSLCVQGSDWPVLCHALAILLAALSVSRGVSTIEPVNKAS